MKHAPFRGLNAILFREFITAPPPGSLCTCCRPFRLDKLQVV